MIAILTSPLFITITSVFVGIGTVMGTATTVADFVQKQKNKNSQ